MNKIKKVQIKKMYFERNGFRKVSISETYLKYLDEGYGLLLHYENKSLNHPYEECLITAENLQAKKLYVGKEQYQSRHPYPNDKPYRLVTFSFNNDKKENPDQQTL